MHLPIHAITSIHHIQLKNEYKLFYEIEYTWFSKIYRSINLKNYFHAKLRLLKQQRKATYSN